MFILLAILLCAASLLAVAYPILTTPALVIDEEVKVSGRIPSKDEIRGWLKQ